MYIKLDFSSLDEVQANIMLVILQILIEKLIAIQNGVLFLTGPNGYGKPVASHDTRIYYRCCILRPADGEVEVTSDQ